MSEGDSPYERFSGESLILRDLLAVARTELANERTFLAYARTALALAAVGGTLVKFAASTAMAVGGYGFVTAGILLFLFGVKRFYTVRKHLARINIKGSSQKDEGS